MVNGVRTLAFPDIQQVEVKTIAEQVKDMLKKERKKYDRRDGGSMRMLSDALVFSTLSQSQQTILSIVQSPPISPTSGRAIERIDAATFNTDGPVLLRWAVNGLSRLAQASYNGLSALRAEVLLAFLDAGQDPRQRRGGIFGGGVAGLLVISAFAGGQGGIGSIFGGGTTQQVPLYGGVI